jgi:hypothetical protein
MYSCNFFFILICQKLYDFTFHTPLASFIADTNLLLVSKRITIHPRFLNLQLGTYSFKLGGGGVLNEIIYRTKFTFCLWSTLEFTLARSSHCKVSSEFFFRFLIKSFSYLLLVNLSRCWCFISSYLAGSHLNSLTYFVIKTYYYFLFRLQMGVYPVTVVLQ